MPAHEGCEGDIILFAGKAGQEVGIAGFGGLKSGHFNQRQSRDGESDNLAKKQDGTSRWR